MPLPRRLWEHTTSSTKPEVHNVLHFRQKTTDQRPQIARRKFCYVWAYDFWDMGANRYTYRHADRRTTDTLIALHRIPTGRSKYWLVKHKLTTIQVLTFCLLVVLLTLNAYWNRRGRKWCYVLVFGLFANADMQLWRSKFAPFLRLSQRTFCSKLIVVPLSVFHRMAASIGDPKCEPIFIFNTSRCGCTILTKVIITPQ